MESNPSDLEILRQRIAELEDEKTKLEEVLRVRSEVFEEQIGELKKTNADLIFENFDLKKEVADLKKELGSRIENVETRLAKVEHGSPSKDSTRNDTSSTKKLQRDSTVQKTPSVSQNTASDSPVDVTLERDSTPKYANTESTGEKKIQREEKLQRESVNQDVTSEPVLETVNILTVDSKVSHDIKSVNRISENSELSRDKKPVTIGNRFSDNSESSYERETIANIPTIFCPEIETNVETTPPAINDANERALATEFVQDLLRELLSPDSQLQAIKFSPPRTIIPGSLSIKKLANYFCQANNARDKSILAKRSEITLWCLFSERFEDKVVELRSNDKKLTDQTARKQIYNEMKPYLTGVSDGYLRTMACRARKINKLFGYEYDPVTLEKIKDQVNSKSINKVNDQTTKPSSHVSEDNASQFTSRQADPQGSERTEEVERVEEEYLASLGITEEDLWGGEVPPKVEEATNEAKADEYDEDAFAESIRNSYEEMLKEDEYDDASIKVFDDSSEDEVKRESRNETAASSSSSNSDSNSDSDSDYDESMERIHDELTRKEVARLEAVEAAKSKWADIKIFDDDFFSDEPIGSNHRISVQS